MPNNEIHGARQMQFVVSATFTAEPLLEIFNFWFHQFKWASQIQFAPLNQVFQQLLSPESQIRSNKGINVFCIRLKDWLRVEEGFVESDFIAAVLAKLKRNMSDFCLALKNGLSESAGPGIVCICPSSDTGTQSVELSDALSSSEAELLESLSGIKGVHAICLADIEKYFQVKDIHDRTSDGLGHIPYTPVFYAALGTLIFRKIINLKWPAYKVIALDCDNTLWDGICGEGGEQGVLVTASHKKFQRFLIDQRNAGKLLCLCSKNNEEDVLAVFRTQPDMALKEEHIAARRINWEQKYLNVQALARELDLGLESFIFIDDDPVECHAMRTFLPQVLTLHIPKDQADRISYLRHVWAFDLGAQSGFDAMRAAFYRQQVQRNRYERDFSSFQEFIEGLELKIDINPLTQDECARASQLSMRVNQFTVTARRSDELELGQKLNSKDSLCLSVSVQDRFGDYGLVGLITGVILEQVFVVDHFLLSCRALGKNIEHHMMRRMAEYVSSRQVEWIEAPLAVTSRNQPARAFFKTIAGEANGKDGKVTSDNGVSRYRFSSIYLCTLPIKYERQKNDSTVPVEESGYSQILSDAAPDAGVFAVIAAKYSTLDSIQAGIATIKQKQFLQRETYQAPVTRIQKQVAAFWEQLLGVKKIGVHDNFFLLGGDSIKAIQCLARIRDAFKIELPITALFKGGLTVSSLADSIEIHLIGSFDASVIEKEMREIEKMSSAEIATLLNGNKSL